MPCVRQTLCHHGTAVAATAVPPTSIGKYGLAARHVQLHDAVTGAWQAVQACLLGHQSLPSTSYLRGSCDVHLRSHHVSAHSYAEFMC